ncbi:MAG TPA: MgtC/SapB family protein [Polyangiales bacterium]
MLDLPEVRLVVALAAGLLIGAEREQRRAQQSDGGIAGLRSFGLIGLFGGLCAYLDSALLLAAGALVVAAAALRQAAAHGNGEHPGVATEMALVVSYVIGATALRAPLLAAALAVLVASLLASGERVHTLLRVKLTRQELRDALVLLLFALVVLPIAPDRHMGPYQAIHPQSLARLVVVLMAVSGAGYVAKRALGARLGLSLLGFAGGFVSSSATIASMGMRARQDGDVRSAAAGALASNVATIVLYALIAGAIDPGVLRALALPLGLAAVPALLSTLVMARLAGAHAAPAEADERAFRLSTALGFVAVASLVTIASAALSARMGGAGAVVVSGIAALIDAHSTTGSLATQFHAGTLDAETTRLAVVVALSANSLTKLVMCSLSRQPKFILAVGTGVLAIAASAWLGLWLG